MNTSIRRVCNGFNQTTCLTWEERLKRKHDFFKNSSDTQSCSGPPLSNTGYIITVRKIQAGKDLNSSVEVDTLSSANSDDTGFKR